MLLIAHINENTLKKKKLHLNEIFFPSFCQGSSCTFTKKKKYCDNSILQIRKKKKKKSLFRVDDPEFLRIYYDYDYII